MKKYSIEVIEVLSRIVEVEAEDEMDVVGEVRVIQHLSKQYAFRFIPDFLSALPYSWLYFHRNFDLIR